MKPFLRFALVALVAACGGSPDGQPGGGGGESAGGSGGDAKAGSGGGGGRASGGGAGTSSAAGSNGGGSSGAGATAGAAGGAQAGSGGSAAGSTGGATAGSSGGSNGTGSLLTEGIDGPAPAAPGCLTFKAKIHDFRSDHPDFQHAAGADSLVHFVGDFLGSDGNPVFAQADGSHVTSADSFAQWWKDDKLNKPIDFTVTATKMGALISFGATPSSDPAAVVAFPFYPIENQGFGNVDIVAPDVYNQTTTEAADKAHNNLFTAKIESQFYYQGGKSEYIAVISDDDSWVFINGKRVDILDMGGVHGILVGKGTVKLDDLQQSHGLKPGKHYPITFFYADRLFGEAQYFVRSNVLFDCKP
jgi:fibro-slime domain-containing protein